MGWGSGALKRSFEQTKERAAMSMREKMARAMSRYSVVSYMPSNLNPPGRPPVFAWRIADAKTGDGNVTGGHVVEEDAKRELRRLQIDAVLDALMEPTEGMYEALSATDVLWRDQTSEGVWKTYIRAAKDGK